jgi:hypothetical protein
MAPVSYYQLRDLADENIVFDDQYHGQLRSFCRDDQIEAPAGLPPAETMARGARRSLSRHNTQLRSGRIVPHHTDISFQIVGYGPFGVSRAF